MKSTKDIVGDRHVQMAPYTLVVWQGDRFAPNSFKTVNATSFAHAKTLAKNLLKSLNDGEAAIDIAIAPDDNNVVWDHNWNDRFLGTVFYDGMSMKDKITFLDRSQLI